MEYLLEEAVFMGGPWLLQPKMICCESIHLDKTGDISCWVVLNMEYLLEETVFMGGAWLLQPKMICCESIHLDKAGDISCWVVLASLISYVFCMQQHGIFARGSSVHGRYITSATLVNLLWKYSSRQSWRYKLLGWIEHGIFARGSSVHGRCMFHFCRIYYISVDVRHVLMFVLV
jgi:hypothetical protein